jgi:hypothetical protein
MNQNDALASEEEVDDTIDVAFCSSPKFPKVAFEVPD